MIRSIKMRLRVQLSFRIYFLSGITIIALAASQAFGDWHFSFLVTNPAFAASGVDETKVLVGNDVVPYKRIPTNAATPTYTEAMAASDYQLATIFGGPGAVAAANGFEPRSLGRPYPLYRGDLIDYDGRIRRGHLSYAMHLYGSVDGTGEGQVYVPSGFSTHSDTPTPTDAAVTFYYPRLGNFRDVTLAVFHVANFRLTYEGDRVCIGNIGGRGGSISSYRHSHLEFYRGDTGLPSAAVRETLRIDPAAVFGTSQSARTATARSRR
jgi:hypothetical protein